MDRYDLTRHSLVNALLTNRWPQLILRSAALGGFLFAILTGLLGTPVGSRNFAIITVWIAWWAALILVAVPILGRGWCSICPIPMPGEWLQNGALLGPKDGGRSAISRRRWPRKLRNIWLQNAAFAALALFSTVVLTQPRVTSWVLAGLLLAALITSLIFERRSFCRYLCPVSGFIGLYSRVAPVEVRVRDTALCASHKDKTCYTGSPEGYGCPWNVFPGGLTVNTNCGTCMECLRTCPYDNIAVNLRAPGADLAKPRSRSLGEAFKAFIMLGSVLVYTAVLLGPWGGLKTSAYAIGSPTWWGYALGFIVLVFGLLPGAFALVLRLGQHLSPARRSLRRTFVAYAYALIPLGLSAWIAFSLSFVFTNGSYLWPVLSDPFGWGWNLLGTASMSWTPYLTRTVPALQVGVILGGLFWSSLTSQRIAERQSDPPHAAWPVIAFCVMVSLGLLWLLIG